MKTKKIIAAFLAICMVLTIVSIVPDKTYAASATVKVNGSQLLKDSDNCITVELKDNDLKVGGVEFFVAVDTEAFSIKSVASSLPGTWELDWVEKNDEQYGKGILCMVQDTSLTGFTEESQELVKIILDDKNSAVGTSYDFDIDVIDVCDENGDTINALIKSEGAKLSYVDGPTINISKDVNIEGFQISYVLGGIRTVSSVEPEIDGKNVVEYGNIYALAKDDISEKDLYIGSTNSYVAAFQATEAGIVDTKYSTSQTAMNYIRTMRDNGATKEALTQRYMVRAYAKLEDGSYVYSNAYAYSIFDVAKVLYDHARMHSASGHEYLYEQILKVVDTDYTKVDYQWRNSVAQP